jgi:hypothetical protein
LGFFFFWQIVLEAAQIWRSTLFSGGLFLEAAQIWRELAFFSGCNLIDEGARQKT